MQKARTCHLMLRYAFDKSNYQNHSIKIRIVGIDLNNSNLYLGDLGVLFNNWQNSKKRSKGNEG
jgi:hypothetical protein